MLPSRFYAHHSNRNANYKYETILIYKHDFNNTDTTLISETNKKT